MTLVTWESGCDDNGCMSNLTLDPQTTALVLIDLQQGIVGRPSEPRSGTEVVEKASRLAAKFRENGATVVLVRVAFHSDNHDALKPQADAPATVSGDRPSDWSELVPEIPGTGDIVVTKRHWGAFYGTELDLQLRRRGIRTIVLAGISTNFGVESTARDAYERGYEQVFVEDVMTSVSAEAHEFTVKNILPRIGRVRSSEDVLKSLSS